MTGFRGPLAHLLVDIELRKGHNGLEDKIVRAVERGKQRTYNTNTTLRAAMEYHLRKA